MLRLPVTCSISIAYHHLLRQFLPPNLHRNFNSEKENVSIGTEYNNTYAFYSLKYVSERKFLTNYGNFSNLRNDAGMDKQSIIQKLSWI